MRMFGVVAILLAVAVLLVSVMKAEKVPRHDGQSCICCSADLSSLSVADDSLSFEAAQESAVELAESTIEVETNRDTEILSREITAKPAPRREAGLKHLARSDTALVREIRSGRYSGAGANVVLR